MKKSTLATLLVFFLLIPFTLFLGTKLPGRSFYITGTLIIIEMLVPFFLAFEGRKPQARELVLMAVLCAVAIVSRLALPIPHFKPIFAVIMLSGIAFGPQAGFMIGALSAFGSNFFVGQGPYTPWQMMAFGAGGLLAGLLYRKNRFSRNPFVLAAFGFLTCLFWIGPLLDCSHIFLVLAHIDLQSVIATFVAGFWVNIPQSVCTGLAMLVFSRPLLEILDRVKRKYGMSDPHAE